MRSDATIAVPVGQSSLVIELEWGPDGMGWGRMQEFENWDSAEEGGFVGMLAICWLFAERVNEGKASQTLFQTPALQRGVSHFCQLSRCLLEKPAAFWGEAG